MYVLRHITGLRPRKIFRSSGLVLPANMSANCSCFAEKAADAQNFPLLFFWVIFQDEFSLPSRDSNPRVHTQDHNGTRENTKLQKIPKAQQPCVPTKIEICTLANRGHWDNCTLKGLNHSPDKRKAKAYIIKRNKSKVFFSLSKKFRNSRCGAFGNGSNSLVENRNHKYSINRTSPMEKQI